MEPEMGPTPTRRRSAPLPESLAGVLDQVRATVLALLASLQMKERDLRHLEATDPEGGARAGLSDIRALRSWADRTLQTLDVLGRGRRSELDVLLNELEEFQQILDAHERSRRSC